MIIEPHPEEYDGYPFITLIQYRTQHVLTIIDNADNNNITAFVLDLCGPEQVDEEKIITVAAHWFEQGYKYPLSFEFSKRGLSQEMSKILRSYNTDFVTRVIGPLPHFDMSTVKSMKRRRRKAIPEGIAVNNKIVQLR